MRGLAVAASLAAALALAGCSSGHGDLDAADSPVARYDWAGGDAMAEQLNGSLDLQDGCVLVNQNDDTRTRVVAVFPRKYTAWRAYSNVLSYGGHNFAMGDLIMAGGGMGTSLPEDGIPAACLPFIDDKVGVFYIQAETIEPPSL